MNDEIIHQTAGGVLIYLDRIACALEGLAKVRESECSKADGPPPDPEPSTPDAWDPDFGAIHATVDYDVLGRASGLSSLVDHVAHKTADQARAHYEPQLAELRKDNDRLRRDRYDALSVHSTDGLLASEWVARTGKAERERKEAQAERDALQKRVAELEVEQKDIRDAVNSGPEPLPERVREQRRQLVTTRQLSKRQDTEIARLDKRVAELGAERDELKRLVDAMESQRQQLGESADRQLKAAETLTARVAELETQNADQRSGLSSQQVRIDNLTAERDELRKRVEELEKSARKDEREELSATDHAAWFSRLSALASRWLTDGPNYYEGQAYPDVLLDRELARLTELTTHPTPGPWVELTDDQKLKVYREAYAECNRNIDRADRESDLAGINAVLEASRPKGAAVWTSNVNVAWINVHHDDVINGLAPDTVGTLHCCFVPKETE